MNLISEFIELMDKGGPIMWVIFIAASIAMSMLIWQFFKIMSLNKQAHIDYQQLENDQDYIPDIRSRSPIALIINLINWREIGNQKELEKQLNITFSEITPLEGTLPTIATIGTLLPMLGLLGTVTGMINVFEVVALHGSGKPEEMAYGISQALLTTASGLIFAIPVIFLHHLLSRKVNHLMSLTNRAMQIILHRDLKTINEI